MDLNQTVKVDVADILRRTTMTVRVIGTRRMRVRFWFASHLIRLASWVMGVGVQFEGFKVEH